MERLFYSTGQVARQLGITPAAARALCENEAIAAETTPGGQWRVPASEVERLKRDGTPPMPRPLPGERGARANSGAGARSPHLELTRPLSPDVAAAADQVAITRSTLEQRRIEREIEENEDWFEERERRKADAEAAEFEREEARRADQRRQQWLQAWIKHALGSLPYGAQGEVEIEVRSEVQEALAAIQTSEAEDITKRLVEAAVNRALAPWKRKQDRKRAIEAAMNCLPGAVTYRSEYSALKQRAWDAIVASVAKSRQEASYGEIEKTAMCAIQPVIEEYEHQKRCQEIVDRVYVSGATSAERDGASEAVRRALAALPTSACENQFRTAEKAALAPYQAAVAQRAEEARLEAEKQSKQRSAEFKVDLQISHVDRYLEQEYEFDGWWERHQEAQRLQPLIRKVLIAEVLENPEMSNEEIRTGIEQEVEELVE